MKRRVRITKKEIEAIKNDGKPEIEAIKLARIRAGLSLYDAAKLINGYQQTGRKSIMIECRAR